jgi:beta-lactamase class A
MTRIFLCFFLLTTVCMTIDAYADENANYEFQILYDLVDADLQYGLEHVLNENPKWRRLIQQKRMAVGLVDLSNNKIRFGRVNGNAMMYAASMPKIAILLAAYQSFEDGSLVETKQIHEDLENMIRRSNNDAATRIIDLIGFKKIAAVLSDPAFGFYDESKGGGLWVGKRYAKAGKRYGDPMFNISHGATVAQVCRFYYLLASNRLINPKRSAQMLQDLSAPGLHHKFVNAIDKLAPGAELFRKSGTWKNWHSDSIMVKGKKWRNYILVAMVESPEGETIIRQILPSIEKVLYKQHKTTLTNIIEKENANNT